MAERTAARRLRKGGVWEQREIKRGRGKKIKRGREEEGEWRERKNQDDERIDEKKKESKEMRAERR